jgi:hypothetical protein
MHLLAYFGISILNPISQSHYGDQLPAGSYGVRIPVEERDIFLLSNVQPGCGAHPASYSIRTGVLSQGKKGGA